MDNKESLQVEERRLDYLIGDISIAAEKAKQGLPGFSWGFFISRAMVLGFLLYDN